MTQMGKAGPLQSLEFTYCVFKRDRVQVWKKQTFQHVISAAGDCWGRGSLQCAGFPKAGALEQSSARSVRHLGGADVCVSCGISLWGSGQLCLEPTSVFHHPPRISVRRSLWHRGETGGRSNQMGTCFAGKVFALGPDAPAGWIGRRIAGKQFPHIHGEQ